MKGSSIPQQTIVVLGCDGFIGSHLLDFLLARTDSRILGWDRECSRVGSWIGHPRLCFRKTDLVEGGDVLRRDIREADVVIHLAAMCNPSLYGTRTIDVISSNFLQVEPIVRACAEYGTHLVHLSTSEVFGRTLASWGGAIPRDDSQRDVFDEHATPFLLGPLSATRWSYACAKQLAERLIEAYGRERGLAWTIVRPFNFVGPRMDYLPGIEGEGVPRVLACFVEGLLTRTPLRLVDGGKARRAFLHISEAIDGLHRILGNLEASRRQVFHFGHPGNETDIRGLAIAMRRIWSQLRGDPTILEIPLVDVSSREFYGEGYDDSDRRMPGIAKARSILGWEPSLDLETTLFRTLSDYHIRHPETR